MGIGEDILGALDPSQNGVGDFFNNDVKGFLVNDVGSFFKNDVLGFIKGDILPIAKNLMDMTVQGIMMPMQLVQNLFKSASSLASGSGLYILVFGVTGIVVVGGIMYYKYK
jgi:hypothetical protein